MESRNEQDPLLGNFSHQFGTRAVHGIHSDLVRVFKIPAFEIVTHPLYIETDSSVEIKIYCERQRRGAKAMMWRSDDMIEFQVFEVVYRFFNFP